VRRTTLLGVALLLVVVTACGSRGGTGGASSGGADVQVTFTPDPLRAGRVTFSVTITNGTTKALDLTFPTGQRADVTLSMGSDTVYRWSSGLAFTQEVGHIRIEAGGNETFRLGAPTFDVGPGRYTLRATVATSNRTDLTASREVTVRSG
jgi:hypothetical protein